MVPTMMRGRRARLSLLAGVFAGQVWRVATVTVTPTPRSGHPRTDGTFVAPNRTNGTRRTDPFAEYIHWVLGASGESCQVTCGGWCNENLLAAVNEEQEMIDVAQSTGSPCDTTLPLAFGEYPYMDTADGSCGFARSVVHEYSTSMCDIVANTPVNRLCYCNNRWGIHPWHFALLGVSCTDSCVTRSGECVEEPHFEANSAEKVHDIAEEISEPCDTSKVTYAHYFPYKDAGGTCAYTYVSGPTCSLVPPLPTMRRFCPCMNDAQEPPGSRPSVGISGVDGTDGEGPDASATGDPHLTNIFGLKFDINRAGITTFLLFPQSVVEKSEVQLRVDANIGHPEGARKCTGGYITKAWIAGTLVGEEIEISVHGDRPEAADAVLIRIGKEHLRTADEVQRSVITKKYDMKLVFHRPTTKHTNNRFNFAHLTVNVGGADLDFTWLTGRKRPNALNFKARSLGKVGSDWGGILGWDDHYRVTQFDAECKRNAHEAEQLMMSPGADGDEEDTATASLD